MADSYHHAKSSAHRYGGDPMDFLPIHQWIDGSKAFTCDFRHRSMRHHSEGVAMCVALFGPILTLSDGRRIPTRWIAEQHVKEDFGYIPSPVDWIRAIKPQIWMGRVPKLIIPAEIGEAGEQT
jgi:hypothetical protein